MIRCCVKACRRIDNWTSSVMLLTRLLLAVARYTRCIIIETVLSKTVIDVGTIEVRNALFSEFFTHLVDHKPALLVCSLFAGGGWIKHEVRKIVSTIFAKLHCFYWSKGCLKKRINNDTWISIKNTWFNCSSYLNNCDRLSFEIFLFQNDYRIRIFTSKKRTNDILFRQVFVCKVSIQRQGPDWHYPTLSLQVVFERTAYACRCCLVQRILLYTQIKRGPLPLIAYGPSKAFASNTLRWHKSPAWFLQVFRLLVTEFLCIDWHESIANSLSFDLFSLAEWSITLFISES